MKKLLLGISIVSASLAFSACGTVATPQWSEDAQSTRAALAVTSDHLTEIAPTSTPLPPTETPTEVPPTATAVPPTEVPPTDVPPTEVVATEVPPTEVPPTEAAVEASGDPENGQALFTVAHPVTDGTSWACSSCHSVTSDGIRLIGPGLWNVATHAESYGLDMTASEYIHESIVDPAAFTVPVNAGDPNWALPMPHGFGDSLTEEEINDIVAYLLTLHD